MTIGSWVDNFSVRSSVVLDDRVVARAMNGAEPQISSRQVTIEDEPEPGDPPPRSPSPVRQLSRSQSQENSHQRVPSPHIVDINTPASDEPEFMSQLAYTNALIRRATMPILPPDLEDFGIPPSPPGTPDPTLSEKLDNFRQLRDRGVYFNDRLGENRGFRNPKLLERLRGYAGVVDEYGSHLPVSVWNPHGFSEDQYYDKLGTISRTLNVADLGSRETKTRVWGTASTSAERATVINRIHILLVQSSRFSRTQVRRRKDNGRTKLSTE